MAVLPVVLALIPLPPLHSSPSSWTPSTPHLSGLGDWHLVDQIRWQLYKLQHPASTDSVQSLFPSVVCRYTLLSPPASPRCSSALPFA